MKTIKEINEEMARLQAEKKAIHEGKVDKAIDELGNAREVGGQISILIDCLRDKMENQIVDIENLGKIKDCIHLAWGFLGVMAKTSNELNRIIDNVDAILWKCF